MQFLYQNCSDSDFQSDYSDEWMRGVQGSFRFDVVVCVNNKNYISGKTEDAKTGQPVKGIAVTYNNPVEPSESE